MDYWRECLSEAFDDARIEVTKEQLDTVAEWVQGAHDNFGLATGRECIPNPLKLENDDLRKKLSTEKSKVLCKECWGNGSVTSFGPYHSSTSQCSKCNGEGRHIL